MFNSNDIKAYHDIKAPDVLKASILSELEGIKPRSSRFLSRSAIRQISALAACFALVLCALSVATLSNSGITLSYRGTEITEARTAVTIPAVMPIAMRARTSGISIPLTLELDRKATVGIEGGSLCLADGSPLEPESVLDSDTELLVFPENGEGGCVITVRSGLKSEVYLVELDENASGYVIVKK